MNNKKSKAPLVLLMVTCMAVSLLAGMALSKNAYYKIPYSLQKYITGITKDKTRTPINPSNENSPIVEIRPVPETTDSGLETTDIYQKVIPSVVCINVYNGMSISASSSGTGIVMTEDGYIMTNAHVVDGASYVNVEFEDGTEIRGQIVGADTATDLAVIKVNATGLQVAEFGDSTSLKVGERAIVIGNAGGLSGSCTTGVISGLDRKVSSSRRSLSLIQTSAAINPGNSGGPLVNRFGQVIGITSSKIASVNYEGIGFAIPISDALPIIQSIVSSGYVTGRAVLGVQVIELNSANGPANGLPSQGAYIASIQEDSFLAGRGVREGDVILEANGAKIEGTNVLLEELEKFSPGDRMNLLILRPETGETFNVTVRLIESKG